MLAVFRAENTFTPWRVGGPALSCRLPSISVMAARQSHVDTALPGPKLGALSSRAPAAQEGVGIPSYRFLRM